MKDFKEQVKQYKQELREYKRAAAEGSEGGDAPTEPTLKRVLASDTTIEKLVELLGDNPRGLLVYRDELRGWVESFTRYKGGQGGSDESNWLSTNRAGSLIYDRKTGTRTTVFVPNAAVSVTGGIQPGTLRRLMTANFFESGLVARILFAMPPRTPKTWSDDKISDATKAAAVSSLDALFNLAPEVDSDGDPRPVIVGLARDTEKRMREFVNQWGIRQFEEEGERAAALAKLEALSGRFALIHHTVKYAGTLDDTQPIELDSLEAGIRLAEWAAQETDRVYAMLAESATEKDIRQLVERVRRIAEKNNGRITVKLLQRAYQRKYRTSDVAKADLERLVGLGLGDWEPSPPRASGGWTPTYFILCGTSWVTGDSSYPCPDQGDDMPPSEDGDSRPDRPDDDSSPPQPSCDGTTTPDEAYGEAPKPNDRQGYEESPVTHTPQSENSPMARTATRPSKSHHSLESSVTLFANPLVTSADEIRTIADALNASTGPVALDTETTGLDPLTDRVRLIQIATSERVWVIDVFTFPNPNADLAPLFDVMGRKEVVGHNLQFDIRMLASLGFTPGKVFDTMLASRVLYAGEREESNARLRHGLEDAVERELGITLDKGEQRSDWSGRLTQRQIEYAAADVQHLLPLANALRTKLQSADLMGTANREFRALPGIAWSQPVQVDVAAWNAIAVNAEAERVRLAEQMDTIAPDPNGLPGMESRNWDSPAQVKQAFAQLGIAIESTDDDSLAGIDHPLAEHLREYRGCAKRVGTYGKAWIAKHAAGGRVLPSWNQLGAESGRMSCSDPNLQQIPRGSEYRRCFIARLGCVLVKADYSQVELRIAAKVANESVMIAAYRDGRDLHTLTAARVLNKPEVEVTKADRQLAKAVNFGLLYGMGWKGLKQYAKANYGVGLTDSQARAYRAAFFKTYPALQAWHGRTEAAVKKLFNANPNGTHEVYTLGGRRRILPVAKRGSDGSPYPNKTDALNTPVQGTGADGLKVAVALLWNRRSECPDAIPVIFCHDEIVLEVPEPDASCAADWLRQCMVEAVSPLIDPVPVEVEVTVGRTWAGGDKPVQANPPRKAA